MAFDVTVIGGGPAGVTAALRARELGANVALVERGRLGGVCTNDGCVPTCVLAKAARLARDAGQFADYGLEGQPPSVDFVRALTRVQQVVYQVQEKKQLLFHLQDVGVTVFSGVGNAYFSDPRHICYGDDQTLASDRFILCVGGSPRRLPFPGNEYAVTHSEVWTMDRLPASVAIVGGGATGCQLASIFNAFGAQVTLIDVAPRLLITEDELVAETFAEQFRQNGIEVITHIGGITSITVEDGLRHLNFTLNNQPVTRAVETVILSVGWPGNTNALNLPAAGVALKGNYVDVNDYLQTSAPHIFAAGDITGRMMLVQSASYEARVAVENALLGTERKAMHRLVPHGGFTDPEYGSIGLTEAQARERYDCVVAVVPYADMDRAVIDGRTVGFCKLIVDRATGLVVGAHVVGELALEVVQLVAAGMAAGLRVEQLADMEIAYPTFSAVVGLAARQIVRELGAVSVVPEWRALKQRRIGEWERRAE